MSDSLYNSFIRKLLTTNGMMLNKRERGKTCNLINVVKLNVIQITNNYLVTQELAFQIQRGLFRFCSSPPSSSP